jgi:hypothetical protein
MDLGEEVIKGLQAVQGRVPGNGLLVAESAGSIQVGVSANAGRMIEPRCMWFNSPTGRDVWNLEKFLT